MTDDLRFDVFDIKAGTMISLSKIDFSHRDSSSSSQ